MGSEVEKDGNADAWARRPYRKKDGVRGRKKRRLYRRWVSGTAALAL